MFILPNEWERATYSEQSSMAVQRLKCDRNQLTVELTENQNFSVLGNFTHWLYPPKSREWLRVSLASDSTPGDLGKFISDLFKIIGEFQSLKT